MLRNTLAQNALRRPDDRVEALNDIISELLSMDEPRKRFAATVSSWWDKWIIDGIGVNGPAILARMISYPARLFEWGLVQWYALVMTAGLVGFVFYYVYH